MILQPTSFKFYGSWILSSLVTTGLQKRGTSSIPRNLGTSKRRQQLNNCVSELLQLGDTPVPLRSHNLPKWFANYRLLLAPSCGQDITPIFSNQIRDLLKQLADLIGKRRVFTPKAIDDIMHVALGPAPTPGHVDCLSTCFPLACTVGSYSARFRRHDKFVSWDFIKCQLLANALPKQCESMLAESRSVLLIKIMDVISFVSQGAYNAIARLHDWFIMDLECFLGMTSSSEEKAAFIGDFLEVLACFQVPLCEPTEAYLYRFFTFAFLSLDQVHSRTWKSTNPMAGWRGIAIAMTINELERVLFKPETAFHVQQYLKATLETGFQFGNQIAPYIPDGVIPPAPKDLPEPGSFIVENGLLGLLTQFEWLNPDGCLEISRPAFVACMPDSLESLVKQATKEYKKATRLVNKTLKLVTELAVEEGIQLPEEENSRLLDDIADSDRRGVMSRAWESSPIKGSVPPMIVQLTSQPPLPNVLKVPKESPIVDFVRGTVTTNPNQVETYALLLLAGEALLSLFRDDSFKDIIDCETAVARMERGLSQLTERLPKGSSVLIEQLALDAMRT
ncbi:MAG: hypothetical protein KVP17_002925, partial [Porospora cf. gigantea B]|uniref:uncharacterized protein n=1 Tax=Porospora cf. gigantea B TaxID=2853592 RepID=UPI003571B332